MASKTQSIVQTVRRFVNHAHIILLCASTFEEECDINFFAVRTVAMVRDTQGDDDIPEASLWTCHQ